MSLPCSRRQWLFAAAAAAIHRSAAADTDAAIDVGLARRLQQEAGCVLLMRHASAPGGGDPPGFRLDDCSTQRNLSDEGRAQARRIGVRLRALQVPVGAVWHSQWCRARETAELLAFGERQPMPLFNSFFDDPDGARERHFVAEARPLLAAWPGPGVLLVVTHQVNITALTGVFPASGEIVAMRFGGAAEAQLLGRLTL